MWSRFRHATRQRAPVVGLWASILLAAGCTVIAGLNADYTVGDIDGGGGSAGAGNSSVGGLGGNHTNPGGGGSTTTSTGGTGGAGGAGGGPPVPCTGTHQYQAVVADCLDLTTIDPDVCEITAGAGELHVTTADFSLTTPHHSFLRFDLDANVAQGPYTSVTLRMVVANTAFADSTSSGEVWRVMPFTRSDLFNAAPVNVGGAAIAAAVGPVALGETIDWPLPTTNVIDNGSVYLAVRPLVSNAVDYYNLNGATPPLLIISCP